MMGKAAYLEPSDLRSRKPCQRKPTAPLALSSTERCDKEPFTPISTAFQPLRPLQPWLFHQAETKLTTLPVLRYSSGHKKGRLKLLSIRSTTTMREIAGKNATEFVERLHITHELWGGQPAWDWGFRGQGNSDWDLLPSAFREGTLLSYANSTFKAPIPQLGDQHWSEFK